MSLQVVLAKLATYTKFTYANQLSNNASPLYYAFLHGQDDVVRSLVEHHGADLNMRLDVDFLVTCVYAVEAACSVATVSYAIAKGACRESIERLVVNAATRIVKTETCNAITCHLLDAGYLPNKELARLRGPSYSGLNWLKRFITMRNTEKQRIATVIGLRGKSALLRAVGRDVVQLIARAMWEMREEFDPREARVE